jgi:hypothetical protein
MLPLSMPNIATSGPVGTPLVRIGEDAHFLSPAGLLMPTPKNHSPPDARHFKKSSK